jgi:threonine dehydrogenase-like Zn-dependent dehydrogenase
LTLQAYQRAIARAVKRKQEEDGEAHCLDIGSGSGLLAVMAARAGASSVVACELHDSLAALARRVRLSPPCCRDTSQLMRRTYESGMVGNVSLILGTLKQDTAVEAVSRMQRAFDSAMRQGST